jgi:hypothetical protein
MREGEVEKLRAVVRDCLGKHLYSSAIFFADKLATLAGNATQDLYMQASEQTSHHPPSIPSSPLRTHHLVASILRISHIFPTLSDDAAEMMMMMKMMKTIFSFESLSVAAALCPPLLAEPMVEKSE